MDDEGESEFVSEQVNEIVKVAFWLHRNATREAMKISPELGTENMIRVIMLVIFSDYKREKPWENPWENHGKMVGKWWFHGIFYGI